MADASLCVTKAMQHELAQNWGINAAVLYDQPPDIFHPASLEERHKLFCRLNEDLFQPLGIRDCVSNGTSWIASHCQNESLFITERNQYSMFNSNFGEATPTLDTLQNYMVEALAV